MQWRIRIGSFRPMKTFMSPYFSCLSYLYLLLILCGDVEMNPGPVFMDINGDKYENKVITGDGACGYRSLSYALCGDENKFDCIIRDCIKVFKHIPMFYYHGVEFAANKSDEEGNIEKYEIFMNECIEKINQGQPVYDQTFWCESGHYQSIALLYDISIYIYVDAIKRWQVYNKGATVGYICLLNAHDHSNILHGCGENIIPTEPRLADVVDYNRSDIGWDTMSSVYGSFIGPFPFVWAFCRQTSSSVQARILTDVDNNIHMCHMCNNKKFKTLNSLEKHRHAFHRVKQSKVVDIKNLPAQLLRCELCENKFFCSPNALNKHMSAEHRNKPDWICNLCDKGSFKTEHALRLHKIKVHSLWSELNSSNVCETSPITIANFTGDDQSNQKLVVANDMIEEDINIENSRGKKSNLVNESLIHNDLNIGSKCIASTSSQTKKKKKQIKHNCTLCGKVFKFKPALSAHNKYIHSNSNEFNSDDSHQPEIMNVINITDAFQGGQNLEPTSLATHAIKTIRKNKEKNINSVDDSVIDNNLNNKQMKVTRNVLQNVENVQDNATTSHQRKSVRLQKKSTRKEAIDTSQQTSKRKTVNSAAKPKETDTNYSNYVRQTSINKNDFFFENIHHIPSEYNTNNEQNNKQANEYVEINTEADRFKENSKFRESNFADKRHKRIQQIKRNHWPKQTSTSDNVSIKKLATYVQHLSDTACDISTRTLSPEVSKLLTDQSKVNDEIRKIICSQEELNRITLLTNAAKTLPDPETWTWNAKLDFDSDQSKFNDERMQFWLDYDMGVTLLPRCTKCGCSDLLFGQDERNSNICHDCLTLYRREEKQKTKNIEHETWMGKVKPKSPEYPRRTETDHFTEYLPDINAAEKAAIAVVHPVCTIKKYFMWYKRLRCESLTLTQDPDPTWAKLLPRTDLKGRFVIIERTVKETDKRYICVDSEKVRQWLLLFFDKDNGHDGILQRQKDGLLELSQEAVEKLKTVTEMAEVDDENFEESEQANSYTERQIDVDEEGSAHASMHPIMSENHVFAFEQKDRLYMNKKEVLKIKDKGIMQFVTDSSRRSQLFNASAKDAFPHLYTGKNRLAPNECDNSTLAARMLRKLMLYPLEQYSPADVENLVTENKKPRNVEKLRWFCAEDDVHMAHQYSAIDERKINDKVGFLMHQRPELAGMDITYLLEALKEGADNNGIIDSHLPGLTQLLTSLQGSREFWFSERMGIETISRDLGDCNWFLTLNFDPRNDYHCRKLIWTLEHAKVNEGKLIDTDFPENWRFESTEHFSKMMDKHAVFVSMLMHHKFETFMDALCDICQIPQQQKLDDWAKRPPNCEDNGWYFARVEFTETRGVAHYHILLHLPHVLPTSLLGRIIQNGRVVRNELKYGNIKEECKEEAFELIELGLLAQQYAINFVESVSMASFYTEQMPSNGHDPEKVIDLDAYCDEYRKNYIKGNINKQTSPLMRKPGDKECDKNRSIEIAKIVAVTQLHQCLPDRCGGYESDINSDKAVRTCRFDYPKKLLKQSVVTCIQLNSENMETQVLLRRTHPRVCNMHPLIAFYWRSNHDSTGIVDAAHAKRYCTKYASKSSKHSEIYVSLLEELSKRGLQNLRNNVRHVLVQIFLASCSHRTFMSKLEIAHRVMQLPMVVKSYSNVEVVSCYWRATLLQSNTEKDVWVYSDRTIFAAYAERFSPDTVYKNCNKQQIQEIQQLNFKEFCETVRSQYKRKPNIENTKLYKKHELQSCEKGTGHWLLWKRRGRGHVRMSTTLNTDLASNYVPIDEDNDMSYTNFFSMPIEKRRQLVRASYELVCYEPWQDHPDKTFLTDDVRQYLDTNDPEASHRYSLLRCEQYYEEYEKRWKKGEVAKSGTAWHKDNQQAYTLYLVHGHNSDLKMRRADNDGRFNVLMEPAEELVGFDLEIRPLCSDDADDHDYPAVENFLPYNIYKDIMEQNIPAAQDISVAYPSQPQYNAIESFLKNVKTKKFIANPPRPKTQLHELSDLQQHFILQAISGRHQVLYLTGIAGSGKTEIILHIMQQLKGRVQACASTGIAARNLNAPTLHGMLGISKTDCSNSELRIDSTSTKCKDNSIFYENIDVFIIDEVNMISAHMLGFVEELFTKSFNPKLKKQCGKLLPFGGKRIIFVGDAAQLPPVDGKPFYLSSSLTVTTKRYNNLKLEREERGLQIYLDYMRPNVTMLQRSQRNVGLLAEISNSLRKGTQTQDQLNKLLLQYKRHAEVVPDRGVHYTNETASAYNFRDLWRKSQQLNKRVFVCKASYFESGNNQLVCDALAALPAKHYNFAPDLLCVYEGCEVRLVKNIDVSAGLVNGAIGTVVKVIYDTADVKFLLEGKHPPPYYLIVDFPEFRGFNGDKDNFTFLYHPTWVALTRQKFTIMPSNVPKYVRNKQNASQCWRMNFPCDVSFHITTHRSQGSTMNNQNILIDLNLQSPSISVPADAGAILYVSITRSNALKHLLVAPIFPTIWDNLCKNTLDEARRAEENALRDYALQFAQQNGYYNIVQSEFDYCPVSENDKEWQELLDDPALPQTLTTDAHQFHDLDFEAETGKFRFCFAQRVTQSVRHIGIDQGVKHFAIVVIDKINDDDPIIVSATLNDLKLRQRFKAQDVVLALRNTELFSYMQLPGEKEPANVVDKIFVHIEQMSMHNPSAKAFGIELATALQAKSPNLDKIVVKLSQPNVLYASGAAFHLGKRIIDELHLKPVSYALRKYTINPATNKKTPNSNSTGDNNDEATNTYNHRKRVSADIFKYIMTADDEKCADMKLRVDETVKQYYAFQFDNNATMKLDDLGDATLHALRDIVCGSSGYKQALPKITSLYDNRTVVITLFPDKIYWVALSCSWNSFICEALGVYDWRSINNKELYLDKDEKFIDSIVTSIYENPSATHLKLALTSMNGENVYTPTNHLKVIIKQQTVFDKRGIMTSEEAGALTSATVQALRKICDNVMGKSQSQLLFRKEKSSGVVYMRSNRDSGLKMQVLQSTGKHLNSCLCFLSWMRDNLPEYVHNQRLILNEEEKYKLFSALREVAKNGQNNLELLTLSEKTKSFLMLENEFTTINEHTRNLIDVLLIGLNKNQQHVKAIALHYRKRTHPIFEHASNSLTTCASTSSNEPPKKIFKQRCAVNKRILPCTNNNDEPSQKLSKN